MAGPFFRCSTFWDPVSVDHCSRSWPVRFPIFFCDLRSRRIFVTGFVSRVKRCLKTFRGDLLTSRIFVLAFIFTGPIFGVHCSIPRPVRFSHIRLGGIPFPLSVVRYPVRSGGPRQFPPLLIFCPGFTSNNQAFRVLTRRIPVRGKTWLPQWYGRPDAGDPFDEST